MMMMLVIMRRNQGRRKEGRNPSAWVVKSFNNMEFDGEGHPVYFETGSY